MSLGTFLIRGCQSCSPTSRATKTRIHPWTCQPWPLLPVSRFLLPFGSAARAGAARGRRGWARRDGAALCRLALVPRRNTIAGRSSLVLSSLWPALCPSSPRAARSHSRGADGARTRPHLSLLLPWEFSLGLSTCTWSPSDVSPGWGLASCRAVLSAQCPLAERRSALLPAVCFRIQL